LRAIVFDERLKHKWSDPTVLPWVEYQLNSTDSSETGVIPFEAKFGSPAATYFIFPPFVPDSQRTSTFLELLNDNLADIQRASNIRHYQTLIECRHLVIDNALRLPVDKVKLYVGTAEDTYEAAK
jgi:hypothetical protein